MFIYISEVYLNQLMLDRRYLSPKLKTFSKTDKITKILRLTNCFRYIPPRMIEHSSNLEWVQLGQLDFLSKYLNKLNDKLLLTWVFSQNK